MWDEVSSCTQCFDLFLLGDIMYLIVIYDLLFPIFTDVLSSLETNIIVRKINIYFANKKSIFIKIFVWMILWYQVIVKSIRNALLSIFTSYIIFFNSWTLISRFWLQLTLNEIVLQLWKCEKRRNRYGSNDNKWKSKREFVILYIINNKQWFYTKWHQVRSRNKII